jgi:murein DD-endopeptidase MepM/ murein hydrolase activator NlpD
MRSALVFLAGLALLAAIATTAPAAEAGEGGLTPTTPPAAAPPTLGASKPVYPIRGPHEYWDGMGAGRGHDGVDIGSPCGTPLVAAQAGRVRFAKYHPRAGNYVVIDVTGSTIDLAYMHVREPARAKAGQSVRAGYPLGLVGDTGNASGCHLHFEVWEGAYYGGGAPIDPMPLLTAWDPDRKRARR